MKKLLAIVLALTMVLALAACGGSKEGGSTAGAGETEATASGETYDVGQFTVTVPANWWAYVQTDMFAETDAEGNYPERDDYFGMIKDGDDEWDAFSNPTIYITYYEDWSAEEQFENGKIWYDEPEDISVTVNGIECLAFEAESIGYIYQVVFLPVTETSCFQIQIPKDLDGTEGVTVDDADVKTIMESLKAK